MKKLYYNPNESEFYYVRETPKTIFIEWVENESFGELLDQNVNHKKLLIKKDNSGEHCLSFWENNEFCVYPFRAGGPFYLEKATKEHIKFEIENCKKWGVSDKYYNELLTQIKEAK